MKIRENKQGTMITTKGKPHAAVGMLRRHASSSSQAEQKQQRGCVVRLSTATLVALLAACAAAAFGAGRIAVQTGGVTIPTRHDAPLKEAEEEEEDRTRYMFDHLDETHAVRSYSLVLGDNDDAEDGATATPQTCKQEEEGTPSGSGNINNTCAAAPPTTATAAVLPFQKVTTGGGAAVKQQPAEKGTANHEPVGQHLLLDLDQVEEAFLDDEARLARAMVELVESFAADAAETQDDDEDDEGDDDDDDDGDDDEENAASQSSTTVAAVRMLSYHCHGMHPAGVSCVGLLNPGGAVTFHTWPAEGVITLDVLVTGISTSNDSFSLLRLLDRAQQLFGVPRANNNNDEEPSPGSRMVWALKRRGFPGMATAIEAHHTAYNPEDDEQWVLNVANRNDRKALVASIQTPFQSVDIFDVVEHESGGGGAATVTDRLVFLDRILQTTRWGEAAYHEALVHPALLAHPDPRRVVIVGGGEGATLREVLKHNTVERAIMVEIDEMMVNVVARQYLPEWSDCSNLMAPMTESSSSSSTSADTASCFDDPRATVYYEDAIQWFLDRYGGDNRTVPEEELIDIIIMDALDPSSFVDFSDLLYDSELLMRAFSNALGEDGILVAQFGEADEVDDPPESLTPDDNFPKFLKSLQDFGFESIIDYDEAHGQSVELRSYLMAMKDGAARTNWFMNEAELQLKIKDRMLGTKDGSPPFRFFDAATMMQYQFPSRLAETTRCLDEPNECVDGHGFDPEIPNFPVSSFEVKPSVTTKAGRGVFAKEFIPKGSLIGLDECVHGMFAPSTTVQLMNFSEEYFGELSDFWKVVYDTYFEGYGWTQNTYGEPSAGVDAGILTFVNHGCNGTYNVGHKLNETEATLEIGRGPHGVYDSYNDVYHPFHERHFPLWACSKFRTLRDIEAGEELLDNYLPFGGSDWEDNLRELKQMCSSGTGKVHLYENRQ